MQKKYGIVITIICLAAALLYFGMSKTTQSGQSLVISIPAPSLKNNLLGDPDTQSIKVYLPSSYESGSKRYPVVYFLPGYGDSFAVYGTTLQKSMDFLLSQNKVNEMIVVTINGINKLHGSYYVNSPVIGNWEDFVVKDVVNYVDQNYRTINDAASRGIVGHSMGGFGAFNLAMRHSNIFGSVYAMSPGFFDNDGLNQIGFDFPAENQYAGLPAEEARTKYLETAKAFKWPDDFLYAYGSAFSPDHEKAPYVKFADKSLSPEARKFDPVWQAWEGGFGAWTNKISTYKENFKKLNAIAIDYGKQDEFTWIPNGCIYVSDQLKQAGITHELLPYDGNHMERVNTRLEENVLPFFSKHLKF